MKKEPGNTPVTLWVAELREDQWQLIVMALDRIREMTSGSTSYTLDHLARSFLRRRITETVDDIVEQVEVSANE